MKLYSEDEQLMYIAAYRDPLMKHLSDILVRFLPKGKRLRIIDIGCGSGRNTILLGKLGHQAVGVEVNSRAITLAKKLAADQKLTNVKFIQHDVFSLKPKALGTFDLCVLSEVIEHVQNYQQMVDFAFQSLTKGGMLFLTTPHDPHQWSVLDEYGEHVRRFTTKEVMQSLRKFKSVQTITIGFPFFRTLVFLYTRLLKASGFSHQPRAIRKGNVIATVYYVVGLLLLRFDSFFTSFNRGTTIVVVAVK